MSLRSLRFAILTIALTAGPIAAITESRNEAQLFQTLGWATVAAIDAIDADVVAALQSRMGADARISNPGGPFNSTDVASGQPSRRLLVAGRAASRWFVAYERGGRGHHVVLVVFKDGPTGPEPTLLARGNAGKHDEPTGWRVGLAELRTALKRGTLTQDNVNEAYY